MGGIGVMLRFEEKPADPSRLEELHRALWKAVYGRLEASLTSELTRGIRVGYISEQPYSWYEGRDPFFDEAVTFVFSDGGDDFPLKYASYHWTDRVCADPAAFAQLQAIAERFGAKLAPREWNPPETIYFPLLGGDALAGIYDDYVDIWTHGGLVRIDFDECPILDYVRELVAAKRCLCEVCRPASDTDLGPCLDAERLAGIPASVEVPDAPDLFTRLDEACEDEDVEIPVAEIAALTGVARRKAELLIAMALGNFDEDRRIPAALVELGACWAAPVLFEQRLDKSSSHEWRETLSESIKALMVKPPVATSGELIDAEGLPIVVFRFAGDYRGEDDAKRMRSDTDAFLAAHPGAQGIVLDASELTYTGAQGLQDIVDRQRPRWWVMSVLSRGLKDHIEKERKLSPAEWLAPSLKDAIAALRARLVADVYELHDAGGAVVETARLEPRGRRHRRRLQEDGQEVEAEILYNLCGGYIELVKRYGNGVVRVEESPVLDAQGNENDACRVGGELYRVGGEVYKVDFNPLLRDGRSMPSDWVEQVAARPTIDRVSLDFTEVPTSEILHLLERCPQLVELYLNRRRLDAELFTSPLLGKLRLVQLHEVEAPAGSVGRLAALHPWLEIEPPPPLFETSGRRVEADGVAILVVSFAGFYDTENAAKMKSAVDGFLAQFPDVQGVVLDATSLSYTTGKAIGDVLEEGRPFVWAVSASSRGLFHYLRAERDWAPREWLFPSVDAAIAAVRAQVVADSYDVHDAKGSARWHTWRKEPRGRRKCGQRPVDGVEMSDETLFDFRGRMIEDLYRRPDATLERIHEYPIRDEAGGENEACRLGASLLTMDGKLDTVSYNLQTTNLPLPADWVDRVAAHPTVTCVVLDGSGATTASILQLLERCPKIDRLWLNSLSLEAELFDSPLLANLKVLWIWNATVPPGAVKALAARCPSIDINPKTALE